MHRKLAEVKQASEMSRLEKSLSSHTHRQSIDCSTQHVATFLEDICRAINDAFEVHDIRSMMEDTVRLNHSIQKNSITDDSTGTDAASG